MLIIISLIIKAYKKGYERVKLKRLSSQRPRRRKGGWIPGLLLPTIPQPSVVRSVVLSCLSGSGK